MLGCNGSLLVLDLPNAVQLALIYFYGVHDAFVFLDGLEDVFCAGQQFLLQNVTLVVNLAVLQIIPVAFAFGFDHHPQGVEVRLLENCGRHAENSAD